MTYKQKIDKLKGELMVIKGMKIKPNFAALGREYDLDWRTVKKYYEGYDGKPKRDCRQTCYNVNNHIVRFDFSLVSSAKQE